MRKIDDLVKNEAANRQCSMASHHSAQKSRLSGNPFVLFIGPVAFVLFGFMHLQAAWRYFTATEVSLFEAIQIWMSAPAASTAYTPGEIGLILHLDRAFYMLLVSLVLGIWAFSGFLNTRKARCGGHSGKQEKRPTDH